MAFCIMVTYNPDINILARSISSIYDQVDHIYLIDNGSSLEFADSLSFFEKIEVYSLDGNFGIGYAQNYGISLALKSRADFILLSDQDTIYPQQYCSRMKDTLLQYPEVCAVSPLFEDVRSQKVYKFFPENTKFITKFRPNTGCYYVFQTIASGMFIRADSLDNIGFMNEELFIDWVDFEWCWRAVFSGHRILLNSDVRVSHYLGDSVLNLPLGHIELRSPTRHYYITRNAFYLAVYCKYLKPLQRGVLFIRSFRYLIGFPILSKPHIKNFKFMVFAFYHGLIGRLGKFDE